MSSLCSSRTVFLYSIVVANESGVLKGHTIAFQPRLQSLSTSHVSAPPLHRITRLKACVCQPQASRLHAPTIHDAHPPHQIRSTAHHPNSPTNIPGKCSAESLVQFERSCYVLSSPSPLSLQPNPTLTIVAHLLPYTKQYQIFNVRSSMTSTVTDGV
jgi:hypothetical protein